MKTWIFTLLFFGIAMSAFATQNKKTIKLRLQAPNGSLSDVVVYFDQGITYLYNPAQDAAMVFNNVPGVPQIFGYTMDKVSCSIVGCGNLSQTTYVQLGCDAGYSGLYNITAIELDNFDPTTIITFEDRTLNTFTDLRENFYQVHLDSTEGSAGRFYLQVTRAVQFSSVNSNCANVAGQINANIDSGLTWATVQLYNDSTQLLASDTNINHAINFDSLQAGNYSVVFTHGQYTATKDFQVAGNFIVASIGVPKNTIYTNEDVVFNAIAPNANQFEWDFGDGTLIDGVAHPDQVYLAPGQYTITLACSNQLGCTDSAQATVMVYEPTGINNILSPANMSVTANGNILTVKTGDVPSGNGEMNIYNLLGQNIMAKPVEQQTEVLNLAGQPSGYYLVSLKNNGKVTTQKVLLAQ